MPLIVNCQDLAKSYGSRVLFENVNLTVSDGDRLGLIGPNGSGKSTLMRIIAGLEPPDRGDRALRKLARVGYVPQDSLFAPGLTVGDVLDRAAGPDDDRQGRIATTLGNAGFADPSQQAATLSGGWRKRLAIAEALMGAPDLLLLDEPTNHLDLEGIVWLERLLAQARYAVVAVSHDRYFLENTATSMAELSRQYANGIFTAEGPYSKFLEKREEYLTVREKLEESLATKVRREVEWLRRGAKARTTKSKARIGEANRLIAELDDVGQRNRTSTARIDFTASDRKTKKLIEAVGVAADGGGRRLFSGLNLTLRPGDRVGLVGPNGCGKSTLLGVLMGERAAAAGTVERADALQIVYFDQDRDQLDPDVPLKRALAEHGDSVQYRGRVVHVNGWAKRFLFRPEQLEVAVHRLSGGERARVLIARLMLREADVLLLDEPTNDLDIPTLEVLEESLLDFPGAMVLVTHDRFLLDRVATTVVGIEPGGTAGYYADYGQWEAAQQSRSMPAPKREEAAPKPAVAAASKKKLSYIEAREFESMEARILEAEATLAERKAQMEDPAVVSDPRRLQQAYADLTAAQASVENLYERWAELEAKAQ